LAKDIMTDSAMERHDIWSMPKAALRYLLRVPRPNSGNLALLFDPQDRRERFFCKL